MQDTLPLVTDDVGRGLGRLTPQRRLVMEYLEREPGHVTAEELHARIRRGGEAVSQATVYRALKLLAGAGVVAELAFGDGAVRYELADARSRHGHLVCRRCGMSVEFDDRTMEAHVARIGREHGFVLAGGNACLYGLCDACAQSLASTAGR